MASSAHDNNDTSLSLSLKKENISSYGGINSNLEEEHSLTDFSDNNSSKKNQTRTNTQNVTFQWDEEESDSEVVYLTGSFCNWKQYFIMPKVDNKYSITLPLPKALHKFKFRINEDFKLNEKYPVMKDGESNCNYIDTSNTKDTKSKSKVTSKNFDDDSSKDEEESNSSDSSDDSLYYEAELEDEEERYKRIKKKKKKKKKYSQIFPKKNYMNNYPPDII